MPAISVSWTTQTAAQTDADSPVNQILMDGYRKNLIHLREWLGAGYTGGAVQDHNHDGINSRLSFPTLAVGHFTDETKVVSGGESWQGAKYYKTLTINATVSPSNSNNGVLVILVEGVLTIGASGKIDLKGYGGAGGAGGGGNGSQGETGGAGYGGGGGGGETSGGNGGNGGDLRRYSISTLASGAAGGSPPNNGTNGSDASFWIHGTNYPLLQMLDPFAISLVGSGGGGGGGGAGGGEIGHAGGSGGGAVLIVCDSLVLNSGSVIDLEGNNGATGGSGSGAGGGGGGAGGSCIIICNTITDSGVSWLHGGGAGSAHIGPAAAGDGGAGGDGIHLIANYGTNDITISDTDT